CNRPDHEFKPRAGAEDRPLQATRPRHGMNHKEQQAFFRAQKKARREKQLAYEAARKKPQIEWHEYPCSDPVEIVKFRISLVYAEKRIYAHNDHEYALIVDTESN